MKFKKKMGIAIIVIFIIIFGISTKAHARDNYAYAAGIRHNTDNLIPWIDDFDAYDDCMDAMQAYENAGYNVLGHLNPSKSLLWDNLYATVQFFAGHGSPDHINFTTTGLFNGNDATVSVEHNGHVLFSDLKLIGTNNVHWDYDTILVTYACCNGAGTKGVAAENSIVKSTAVKGADVAVGFTDEINVFWMDDWTKRYNEKLGEGYGVWDAVCYANSFSYLLGGEKNNAVWSHGNPNMKIGKYGKSSKNVAIQRKNIFNNIENDNDTIRLEKNSNYTKISSDKSTEERNVYKNANARDSVIANEENIDIELKKIYNKFEKDNYQVEKYKSCSIDVNTNEKNNEITYYDYKLKIGDFLTNAAYTIVVDDNKIKAIYDNNIDIEKQEKLLQQSSTFKANVDMDTLKLFDDITEKNIQKKYDYAVDTIKKDYVYYYDIENDKRYVINSHTTQEQVTNIEPGKAIDSYMYEI